jgi:histidine ammonia-lyase
VDSLPTSANQEDHVSMATFAGRRLAEMVDNTAVIVGIEAMAAAQGIELKRGSMTPTLGTGVSSLPPEGAQPALGRPGGGLKSSQLLEAEFASIRERVAFIDQDHLIAPDIEAMRQWARRSEWPAALLDILPSQS